MPELSSSYGRAHMDPDSGSKNMAKEAVKSNFEQAKLELEQELADLHELFNALQDKVVSHLEPGKNAEKAAMASIPESREGMSEQTQWVWRQISQVRQLRDRINNTTLCLDLG